MKNFKTKTIFTTLFLGVMLFANAQENARTAGKTKGKVVDLGPKTPRVTLCIGFGNTMPSSTTKDGAFITNSSAISADVSIPFASFRKGWDGTVKGKSYFSLNIGGQYNFGGNGNPSKPLPSAFAISGQTASSVTYKGVDPKNPGFRIGAGPEANFNIGKFTISPMVLAEYFSMTQKELSAVQTTQYNGQTLQYNLFTLPETKTSGFAITPKVRIHYMFTQSFGLFVDGSYIFGPKVETQLTSLVPEGNPQTPENTYNQQQLDNGTYVKGETKSTSYTTLGINVGFSYSFKPRKGWNGVANSSVDKTKFNQKDNVMKQEVDKGWNGVVEGTKMTKADSGKQPSEETLRKGWDGTVKVGKFTKEDSGIVNNQNSIITRNENVSLPSTVVMTVNYNGNRTSDQLPIVEGNLVTGNISDLPKGTKIKILQSYSGDEGTSETNENGNFSILLNHDTVHVIYVNNEEYGKIKIEGVKKNLERKGWNKKQHATTTDEEEMEKKTEKSDAVRVPRPKP